MFNKYASQLIPAVKIKEFDQYLNFGYLVETIPITRKPEVLKYQIFLALVEKHGIALNNKLEVCTSLMNGENTSEVLTSDFVEEFNSRLVELRVLKVPSYLAACASIGFFLTIISAFSVLFIKWWLVFIVPPVFWFLTQWSKNMYVLNYTAIVSICAYCFEDFKLYLEKNGELRDVLNSNNPLEELQKISFISTFGSNGAGTISTSLDGDHDHEILEKIRDDLNHQKNILSDIHRKIALNGFKDAYEEAFKINEKDLL